MASSMLALTLCRFDLADSASAWIDHSSHTLPFCHCNQPIPFCFDSDFSTRILFGVGRLGSIAENPSKKTQKGDECGHSDDYCENDQSQIGRTRAAGIGTRRLRGRAIARRRTHLTSFWRDLGVLRRCVSLEKPRTPLRQAPANI